MGGQMNERNQNMLTIVLVCLSFLLLSVMVAQVQSILLQSKPLICGYVFDAEDSDAGFSGTIKQHGFIEMKFYQAGQSYVYYCGK